MNTRKSLAYISSIATLVAIGGCNNPSGTYEGTCTNTTYGKQSNMLLVLNKNGEQLSGTLALSGDLVGGGDIKGRVDNSRVTFTTANPAWGQITWTGELKSDVIIGKYLVETPLDVQQQQGIRSQQGVWSVKKN